MPFLAATGFLFVGKGAILNRGRLRHPLFGNRNFWFNQDVKPGFFTDTIAADADGIRKRVFDAIDDTVNRSI